MESQRRPGRPRVENNLADGWVDIIIQSGKEGKHITDFLIILGISWDAHWALMERNKDYYRAVKEYEKFCEQYWYNQMHAQMDLTSKGEQIETKAPIQIEIIKNTIKEDDAEK